MDWSRLFFSPEGRIGQKDYWIGVLILVVLWVLSHLAHVFAPLVWLLLLWPWVCVIAKRLHDFNRSGWMILIPVVVGCVAVIGAIVAGGAGLIGAIFAASTDGGNDAVNWMSVLGAVGVALGFLGVAAVVKIVFLIWVGAVRGDAGPNRYGAAPGLVAPSPPATV